jgi:hypothetical protein
VLADAASRFVRDRSADPSLVLALLRAVGEEHRLEHVDRLGDVRHHQPRCEAVEDVEVQAGDQGVAERVLLVEEAGVGAGLDVEPGAPLVDHQADSPGWVVAVHDRSVAGDELVHPLGVHHRLVVILEAELGRAALRAGEVGEGPFRWLGVAVVVQGDRLEVVVRAASAAEVADGLHQRLGPGVVVDVGPQAIRYSSLLPRSRQ